jgi:hypothetical protein
MSDQIEVDVSEKRNALLRPANWSDTISIKPQIALQTMADVVRAHMDKRRRAGPKWKFRLAPDLIVQIQPMLPGTSRSGGWVYRHDLSFEGLAYEGDGVDAKTFTAEPEDLRRIRFRVEKDWTFRAFDGRPWLPIPDLPRDLPREQLRAAHYERDRVRSEQMNAIFTPLRDRILAVFEAGFFEDLKPGHLLGSQCFICDRKLTDAISRARHIGPECAGTASVNVPWFYLHRDAA